MTTQRAKVIWFTGLPCAGKTTLVRRLEKDLTQRGFKALVLDADEVRAGLNRDLGFTELDRKENIRRVAEMAKLFIDSGLIILAAFVSPFEIDRHYVQSRVGKENYVEIFVDCLPEICERRDVKGMYKKARSGELKNFTGIDSPYERPSNPDLVIDTARKSIQECVEGLVGFVVGRIVKHPIEPST